jgi:hypothetical protein
MAAPTPPPPPPADPRRRRTWAALLGFFAALAVVELLMGRTWLGPDGRFGLWESDIWSAANSQRLADPYSFSHLGHGILFYALLWAVGRRLDVRHRLLIAAAMEAAWEILENSPIIINRYRAATIAAGYEGDSVLNSLSDLLMMTLGFLFAGKVKAWQSVVALVAMELGCLLWVRDNLTLNVIMLVCPIEAIKAWQAAGRPL